jgi:hypothetical protein
MPIEEEINKDNCIAVREDFGMPVADYGIKCFFDPVMHPLQAWNTALRRA